MIKKTAAILAGGKSSRMNYKNKAFLRYENSCFIEKIIKELRDYDEVIIVSNNPEEYKGLGVKVIKDVYPSQGPLSGIHSALSHMENEYCLVVACDMPFINRDIVDYLGSIREDYEILIPRVNERLQPLCGIYKKSIKEELEKKLLKKENKLIAVCYEFKLKIIGNLDGANKDLEKNFLNINTEEEYKALIKK
ncbi:molybdenum cofactor guanylyltransferase [Clostridium sp. B9]|uniref:molybdenum cofactor guanylyltransferase n=1 Tax=Clostridium sp. B9 TaxID=3423224 RepID=UPI003D2F3ED2